MTVRDESRPPAAAVPTVGAGESRPAVVPAEPQIPRLNRRVLPAVVLLAGVALSFMLSRAAREGTMSSAEARFQTAAANAAVQIESRFAAYGEVLAGLQALFHTREVTREEFRRYTSSLDLPHNFPGFQVLNFAPQVPASARAAFEMQQREDPARARFAIKPPGVRDIHHPITLIEPLAGNEQYLGLDIGAAPPVHAALEWARDTGRLASSGKLIPARGADGQVGLAARLPVYAPDMPLDMPEQRRAAYRGSVGAGFLVAGMLSGLEGEVDGLRLRLYDDGSEAAPRPKQQGEPAADRLLFEMARTGSKPAAGNATQPAEEFRDLRSFTFGGRRWLVETTAPVAAGVGVWEQMLPVIVLGGGCVLSLSLAGLVFSILGAQGRAMALARHMTRSLRRSERRLVEAQRLAKLGSWVLDPRSGAIECCDEARRIYGLTAAAQGLTLSVLLATLPVADRQRLREAIALASDGSEQVSLDHAVRAGDSGERWVHVELQRSDEAGGLVQATVRDETARQRAAVRLELAHDIARTLAVEADAGEAVAYILATIGARQGWGAVACWLPDQDGQLRCLHAWSEPDDPLLHFFADGMRGISGARPGSPLETAWSSSHPVWRVLRANEAADEHDRLAVGAGLQAALAVPVQAGTRLALLEFFSRIPVGVDAEVEGFMRSVASQLAQYLQRQQAECALRYAANHDALTGLAGRPLLHERLAHAIQRAARQGTRVAVLFMDLDRFKQVNDSLGHSAGDQLLRACADRLRNSVREADTVARFGGDEFVLVLEGLNDVSDAMVPATKVLHRFAMPFEVQGRELLTTTSIGISLYPDDGHDAETLLMNADAAMYRAKERGPGGYHFYSAQMNAQGEQRLTLESALHRALERGELYLVYQPKMELSTGAITGVEALMRWQHSTLGAISPAQFIPIAEDTGLIEAFGQWALEQACRDARRWQDEGHPVQVSVNLSARQLGRPHLVQEVHDALIRCGLEPGSLELEITESGVMHNPARAAAQLKELREAGVSVAIDDFGTGYSSLSYLQRFPLCTLKIDRAFIKDLPTDTDAAALTAGIIGLAHALRMTVVAEGVETLEQLACLRSSCCDQIQGYYLSKPITADEMSRFLGRDLRHLVGPTVAA